MTINASNSATKKDKPAKYTMIKQYICEHIESGEWPQNAKVPSENELTQQFDVSRMTARRALQELTEQGILVRSQGAGTFVATFKSQSSLLEIRNISDEISDRGHQHKAKQLLLNSTAVTDEIAILLNLKNNEDVFYSEILHYENDDAIQLEQRFVNVSLVPDYLLQNFTQITPHEYLSSVAPLTEATHEIEAILASDEICQQLDIQSTTPCLQVKRRTWSKQGVVSVAILTSPGDKYRLGSHLKF
ncbi:MULTISPECIES: histidine utilization repressor [Colwellia]|uniref:Histidine utilization repressor n=1 Tax=Colwellia psychrerythraea (strain 34H / ATCC BAA-681) TaxID=167879 RepID=Q487V6_COLP3|nr:MULTISPECIES: histidine utilization repressor [Colwellia]AAZ26391.1 histidine utilization repressor [Colwellia psychrerythraea 34H]PKH89549.1 histidine utilization repressor [Colwellia sp. Bg11-28]